MTSSVVKKLRQTARNLGYSWLLRSGVIERAASRNRHQARILLYHSVASTESPFTRGLDVTIKPTTFARQIAYLHRHYQVVSLAELTEQVARGCLEERCVVITFDDGFADNYRYALPILQEHNLPATIFLVADALDNRTVLWMHRLAYLVNTCGAGEVLRAAESVLRKPLINGHATAVALRHLREKLTCGLGPAVRDRLLDTLCEMLEVSSEDASEHLHLYLNRAELAPMRASGVTFGCHGATHTAFVAMSEAEQEEELRRTWDVIAPWLNGSSPALAYPFGESRHYTTVTRRLALELGHRCLLAASGGWITAESDRTALDRIKVEEEPLPAFAARLEGISLRSWRDSLRDSLR